MHVIMIDLAGMMRIVHVIVRMLVIMCSLSRHPRSDADCHLLRVIVHDSRNRASEGRFCAFHGQVRG